MEAWIAIGIGICIGCSPLSKSKVLRIIVKVFTGG